MSRVKEYIGFLSSSVCPFVEFIVEPQKLPWYVGQRCPLLRTEIEPTILVITATALDSIMTLLAIFATTRTAALESRFEDGRIRFCLERVSDLASIIKF
jgi:hypothetical protein